jgi:hypothetical protein
VAKQGFGEASFNRERIQIVHSQSPGDSYPQIPMNSLRSPLWNHREIAPAGRPGDGPLRKRFSFGPAVQRGPGAVPERVHYHAAEDPRCEVRQRIPSYRSQCPLGSARLLFSSEELPCPSDAHRFPQFLRRATLWIRGLNAQTSHTAPASGDQEAL